MAPAIAFFTTTTEFRLKTGGWSSNISGVMTKLNGTKSAGKDGDTDELGESDTEVLPLVGAAEALAGDGEGEGDRDSDALITIDGLADELILTEGEMDTLGDRLEEADGD